MHNQSLYKNLNSIMEKRHEALQLNECDGHYHVKCETCTLYTIPLIICEERHIFSNSSKCQTQIMLGGRDEYEAVTFNSERINNPNDFIAAFGNKPFADFTKEAWSLFRHIIYLQLSSIEQRKIYCFYGWIKDNDGYIIGNKLIERCSVSDIESSLVKNPVSISNISEKEVCERMNNIAENISSDPFVGNILFLYNLLGHLKQRLCKTKNTAPEFLMMLIGQTGSFKTSVANAIFNPIGLPCCSFEDSEAAIRRSLQATSSGTLIVDDFKCQNKENNKKLEVLTRISGDITTAAKRVTAGEVDKPQPTGMVVVTGEERPHLQSSSYARIMFIDLNIHYINKEYLSQLQNNKDITNAFVANFIRHIIQDQNFDNEIVDLFTQIRDAFINETPFAGMHGRYYEMYAWFDVLWLYYTNYLTKNGVRPRIDFEITLKNRIYQQYCFFDNNPVKLFCKGFLELKAKNELIIIEGVRELSDPDFDVIDYTDTFFVKSGNAYKKVRAYWKINGMDFPYSERALRNSLHDEGLLQPHAGKNTFEKKISGKSISGYTILKNTFLNYGGNCDE